LGEIARGSAAIRAEPWDRAPSQGDMEMTRKFAVLAAVVGSLAAAAGGAPPTPPGARGRYERSSDRKGESVRDCRVLACDRGLCFPWGRRSGSGR
jgi:hypothetical protein